MIARDIYEKGIDNAIVSLGGEGAVFAYKRGVMVAKAPSVPVCSTIGAGDSMLAGFIDGTSKGANKEKVFKRAVAFGTAACKQEGTKPPSANDVEELIKMVKVKKM